jgi:hypothetical protein
VRTWRPAGTKGSAPPSYAAWNARAVALMRRPMPEREWKRMFIAGLTPEDAARQAETYWHNATVADRTRRRRCLSCRLLPRRYPGLVLSLRSLQNH